MDKGEAVSLVAVLPSIYPLWTDRCLAGMSPTFRTATLVVDNTETNIGVGASWNRGIGRMNRQGADWLVIVSAASRFGAPGGDDFLAELDAHPDAVAIEAGHGIGWHLIAFPRSTIEVVGRFDENFFAYEEDIDYGRRISLALLREPPYWSKVSVDVSIAGFSHGVDLGGVRIDNHRQCAYYYAEKWNGPKGAEKYDLPFGDKPIGYWPPI